MTSDTLHTGQVVWLRLRFEKNGEFSQIKHPYLVIDINDGIEIVEVLQFDSLKGREYQLAENRNIAIKAENETVITEDSYVQLGKIIKLQKFDDLVVFRKTVDKLSRNCFEKILWNREEYIRFNDIEDNDILFFTKEEILEYNQQ